MQYIDKSAIVAEIEKIINEQQEVCKNDVANGEDPKIENISVIYHLQQLLKIIDALKVKDPYEECIQYDSINAGIQANAETYSFNIESRLFNQLTKEQQGLWRKEIEQAYISGGDTGVELARDPRYKENLEVKEVDLEKEIDKWWCSLYTDYSMMRVPNHKFVPKPAYIDSNFKQSEIGKTKIAFELWMDWKVDSDDIEWDADTIRNFAKHFFELGLKAQKGERM